MDVFVCGMAGIREAASRQGPWQPLPAGTAARAAAPSWMNGSGERGEACCLLPESRVARLECAFLGRSETPGPICSSSLEPGKRPVLSAATLSKREHRLTINHRLMAKIECQSKVYGYQVYEM